MAGRCGLCCCCGAALPLPLALLPLSLLSQMTLRLRLLRLWLGTCGRHILIRYLRAEVMAFTAASTTTSQICCLMVA